MFGRGPSANPRATADLARIAATNSSTRAGLWLVFACQPHLKRSWRGSATGVHIICTHAGQSTMPTTVPMDAPAPADPPQAPAAPPLQVAVRDLRANLAHYLQRAAAGESLAILSRGEVVAQLGPPASPPRRPNTRGILRGRMKLTPGWDDPDEELYDLMEHGHP